MRKQLLVIALLTILSIKSYSQIIFENGYFINESDKKIECLIKNTDWKNNPTEFKYKLSQNDEVQKATIQTVKEFAINNGFKYIRAKTNIDRSYDELNKISTERNPSFHEELLFLKVLIEGKASLFIYIDGILTRFFYKLNDSEINQLVYKKYLVNDKILTNDSFKQQLFLQLNYEETQIDEIKRLRYNVQDLERCFIRYNERNNSNYISYEPKQQRKDIFNLTIRPGLRYSSLEIQNTITDSKGVDFGNSIGVRFGIEAEYILPYNKNNWAIIIEPTYQYFKSEQSREVKYISGGILVSKVDYKSIELPIGVRYYSYFNDKSKLFANISYVLDFQTNSSVKFLRNDKSMIDDLEIKSRGNFALGIGYKYKNRYSLEIQYNTNREILGDYLCCKSNYNSINIILGISIF